MKEWCVKYYDIDGNPRFMRFGSRLDAYEFADIVGGYVYRWEG